MGRAFVLDALARGLVEPALVTGEVMHLRARGGTRIAGKDEQVERAAIAQDAEVERVRGKRFLGDRAAFEEHVEPGRHEEVAGKLAGAEMHHGTVERPSERVLERGAGGAWHAGDQDRGNGA